MVAARGDSKDVFNVGEKWERQCGRRIVFARQDSCNASAARTVKQAADRVEHGQSVRTTSFSDDVGMMSSGRA